MIELDSSLEINLEFNYNTLQKCITNNEKAKTENKSLIVNFSIILISNIDLIRV